MSSPRHPSNEPQKSPHWRVGTSTRVAEKCFSSGHCQVLWANWWIIDSPFSTKIVNYSNVPEKFALRNDSERRARSVSPYVERYATYRRHKLKHFRSSGFVDTFRIPESRYLQVRVQHPTQNFHRCPSAMAWMPTTTEELSTAQIWLMDANTERNEVCHRSSSLATLGQEQIILARTKVATTEDILVSQHYLPPQQSVQQTKWSLREAMVASSCQWLCHVPWFFRGLALMPSRLPHQRRDMSTASVQPA